MYYFHLEAVPTDAPNKTWTPTQENVPSCGGNVCIYCGNCRDWIYDDDADCGNKYDRKLDKRRWHRTPDAKCFFGDHHFPPYYHHVADFSDDSERHFYGHFYNVCKCV